MTTRLVIVGGSDAGIMPGCAPAGSPDNPAGQSLEDVRPIRDEIERRVRDLLSALEVPAAA